MSREKQIQFLIQSLLTEMPQYKKEAEFYSKDILGQRRLLRTLMNVCPPIVLSDEFYQVQDALLTKETWERGIVTLDDIKEITADGLYLWQGDITRLAVDGIVNAANEELLGCFHPCHNCIDNVIHSAAGLQLRNECNEIMVQQGYEEPVGRAKITSAYNLPSKYVIHTVGPNIRGTLQEKDRENLKKCYQSSLKLAKEHQLMSIAFCCISTGEFHFPNEIAAQIAIDTVREFVAQNQANFKVVFNVFSDVDDSLYRKLLF